MKHPQQTPTVTGTPTLGENGATINGRPALSEKDVQGWFNDAFQVEPVAEEVRPIAEAVNYCALFVAQWKRTPEFDEMRRSNPSMLRARRIGGALATLQNELPGLIDDTWKVLGDKQADKLVSVVALLDSVNLLEPGFQKFQRRSGREPDPWHRIAQNLRPLILAALRSCEIRAGFELRFKIWHVIKGEAEGRFAIAPLVVLALLIAYIAKGV